MFVPLWVFGRLLIKPRPQTKNGQMRLLRTCGEHGHTDTSCGMQDVLFFDMTDFIRTHLRTQKPLALVPKPTIHHTIIICKDAKQILMTDIIWGYGSDVLSADSFVLRVTHKKNENRHDYSDREKVTMTSADLPGLPQNKDDWTAESLRACVIDAFLKCEVDKRDDTGTITGKVSHSGAGGY